ncbi:hypothetical protein PoB_006364300 [Plakobranchus ocellatus]|uniref:Uncharacterized protein n=1 Tax=Plakobranchus ocellatus TaxID=259542 RepID=A0AAV4CYY0_9GAST|nr:hypothetical protein PoB_006364300 [Plakobranchus ocellatus]
MVHDDIYRIVRRDKLILRFVSLLFKKLGKAKILDISQRMRQLGRLVSRLLQIDGTNNSLQDFITDESFDTVIRATEEVSEVMSTDDEPSKSHPLLLG